MEFDRGRWTRQGGGKDDMGVMEFDRGEDNMGWNLTGGEQQGAKII